ncbi:MULTISPECIES: LysR family transcriptional regulator [Dactylosporangium]|nr:MULTISPECIES: LysR family transcriptional regulator [Dactylosporangium]UAB97825.1 LysR family transcriptional regulator [Dactylosporangium vinaceum]UWZ46065.1 LysR family transcriptional regulator [Dactylosporangium matsuzakiense]
MHLDLNLLTALDALLEENSVTAAAARLHLSEPAMSRTLARIRTALHDPVLVRSGRRMVPTPRAVAIRAEVRELLHRAHAVFAAPAEPDPATLERTFTMLAGDLAVSVAAPLIDRIAAEAPGVRLRFLGETPQTDTPALRSGEVDLDIGVVNDPPPDIRTEVLLRERLVPIVRAGHPLTRGRLTLRRFADAVHVSASRRGRLTGPIDDVLERHGLRRRVALSTPTFAAAMLMVAQTDLVGLGAERFGRSTAAALNLVTLDVPGLDLPPIELAQAWHARFDADGAHRWLRTRVKEVVVTSLS